MPEPSNKFKTFAIGLSISAGLLVLLSARTWQVSWLALLVFALAGLLTESFTIELPKHGAVSVSFIILQAAVLAGGPTTAAVVGLSMAVAWRDVKTRTSIYNWLFNGSQYCLAAGGAAIAYAASGGPLLSVSRGGLVAGHFPGVLLPLALATTTFFALNTVLVAIAIGLVKSTSPISVWRANVRWAVPNYFALAPLGVAVGQVYLTAGPIGVVLVIVPLLIARQTFQVYMRLRNAYLDTIRSLIAALEAKDSYTRGHSERVAGIAVEIGRNMGLSEEDVETLRLAGILHDIGKIGIARHVLRKPGKLSAEEFQRVALHPESGAMILREVSFLGGVVPIVFHHHEHWDGSGYVDGIAGEEIPLPARILAVADAFDAMTSPRPYRGPMPAEAAYREIDGCAGSQFDPDVVEAFLEARGYRPAVVRPVVAEGQLTLGEARA